MLVDVSTIEVGSALGTVAVGFLFGFGFSVGSWLWGVIVGAFHKKAA